MIWIAPSEKDTANAALEKHLWDAADTATRASANPERGATWRDFRRAEDHWSANSGLKSREYSAPVLGLIFLRFAEVRFAAQRAKLLKQVETARPSRRSLGEGGRVDDPHDATGRFDFVLASPPFNVNAVDTAMRVSARRHPEGTPQDLPERQDHERLKDMVGPGRRFPLGLPRTDNANGGDSART